MGKVLVSYLIPGATLSHPIEDDQGKILFHSGHKLSEQDIQTLVNRNVAYVYVDTEGLFELREAGKTERKKLLLSSLQYKTPLLTDVAPMISEATQKATIDAVYNVMDGVRQGSPVDFAQSQEVVESLVMEIIQRNDAMVNLIDILNLDDYTFSHSINVCVLSMLTAIKMKLPVQRIKALGMGALLHDIGKMRVREEILHKEGPLTEEEFAEVQMHTIYSRDILQQDVLTSRLSINIAYQHHEKFNGSGYPQGLRGNNIDFFARLVAIANVYDALTTHRFYRPRMEPYNAMKTIISGNGINFDPKIVDVFVRLMSVYPIESVVKLSSGELAIVIKASERSHISPVVRLLFDDKGKKISGKEEIDLSEDVRYISGIALETSSL